MQAFVDLAHLLAGAAIIIGIFICILTLAWIGLDALFRLWD
jgi:hypothetical protein